MAETALLTPPRVRGPQHRKRAVSLLTAAALAFGGVLLAPLAAQAAEQPSFTAEVTEVANERIDIAIEGDGYGDVQALPGQSEPHAYFTVIEKDSDLSEVGQADTAISATVAPDGTVSDVLAVPADELVEGTSYEVISWPSRSFPTTETLYARTDITIDWAALFPASETQPEPAQPNFTAEVTEKANEGIDVAIEGDGYGDVQALPGQSEPHAYFTLIEKDSDLSEVGQADTAISATVAPDGTVSDVLSVPADELVEGTSYEVISWPSRSFPTAETLYARADITIDWAVLFPVEEPVFEPSLSVDPASDLDPEGDTVTVTGTGYNPAQGIYVFICEDVDLPADLWALALGCRDGATVIYPSDDTTDGRVKFDEDGAFKFEFDVQQLNEGATSIYTAANHTASTDRGQDAKATLAFAEAQPEPAQPNFTADVTENADEGIDIAIEGSGYDDVQALPGQTEPHAYFTLIEKDSDLSDVSQTDTAISASIEADGTLSDVLSVPADELVEGTSYEVISWPSRSNPTEENLYARTDITIDWVALFPDEETPGEEEPGEEEPGEEEPGEEEPGEEEPGEEEPGEEAPGEEEPGEDTPGEEEPGSGTLTITDANGNAVTSVTQGDDIGFTVSPVEVGAEFTVTVESDPVTLPNVVTDADGVASTTWTIPEDFEPGEHTVTFVAVDGADSYSAAFEVLAIGDRIPDDGDSDDGATDTGSGEDRGSGDEAAAGGTANEGGDDGTLAATGADALPYGLVGIAGVLTLLLGAAVLVASRRASARSVR